MADSKKDGFYKMRIERTIVDKLGLKLYDKVSAVVAELIANSYDADAEHVIVKLPLGKALATVRDGNLEDKGFLVEIIDDGHGMTPKEANDFFLRVGRDRRKHEEQGNNSRHKRRKVMGRKGIGKLAPFGVCKIIEVRSTGGEKTKKGYKVTHFKLDYDEIVEGDGESFQYEPTPLEDDQTFDSETGTIIRLKNFHSKRVPDKETFNRQLSSRFSSMIMDFKITIHDIKKEGPNDPFVVSFDKLHLMENTRTDVGDRPVELEDGKQLKVNGWMALSKKSHSNSEFAGVRIYVRGKLAAITRDFGLPAGFTGEFVARSYLVGEITADWLDEGEDLIQTHRQDILWETPIGKAFSKWGQFIIKEIAKKGREPRRETARKTFLEISKLEAVAKKRFKEPRIQKTVLDVGKTIAGFAHEDDLKDKDYVNDLVELILSLAPHKLLIDTFKKIANQWKKGELSDADLSEISELFDTANVAEIVTYGQLAYGRLRTISVFEKLVSENTPEDTLQKTLEGAPWLISPQWNVMTQNQTLETFRKSFESWYKEKYGEDIITTTKIPHENKRPDFILLDIERSLKVLEIKSSRHVFDNNDYSRLERYYHAFTNFFKIHSDYVKDFPNGFEIRLITGGKEIRLNQTNELAFTKMKDDKIVTHGTWRELLRDTKKFHENFLEARNE